MGCGPRPQRTRSLAGTDQKSRRHTGQCVMKVPLLGETGTGLRAGRLYHVVAV